MASKGKREVNKCNLGKEEWMMGGRMKRVIKTDQKKKGKRNEGKEEAYASNEESSRKEQLEKKENV